MIKILEPIKIDPLLETYNKLDNGIEWTDMGFKGRQVGLQYKIGDDHWTSAVGRSKGHELTYDQINPYFKDTIFENIINKYNLKRTRLMWCNAYACYSLHKDATPRIHIPLITNPNCYFLFPESGVTYIPAGLVYWVDTRKPHTFINCSEQNRLHLVGVVES